MDSPGAVLEAEQKKLVVRDIGLNACRNSRQAC